MHNTLIKNIAGITNPEDKVLGMMLPSQEGDARDIERGLDEDGIAWCGRRARVLRKHRGICEEVLIRPFK